MRRTATTTRSERRPVGPPARLALLAMLALLVSACAGPGPTGTPGGSVPSGTPTSSAASLDPNTWIRSTNVEQPTGFMTAQTGVVITRGCAPCHPAIDTLMTGVTNGPEGS